MVGVGMYDYVCLSLVVNVVSSVCFFCYFFNLEVVFRWLCVLSCSGVVFCCVIYLSVCLDGLYGLFVFVIVSIGMCLNWLCGSFVNVVVVIGKCGFVGFGMVMRNVLCIVCVDVVC